MFNYILIAVVFIPIWLFKFKQRKLNKNDDCNYDIKKAWWKYLLVSLADVEANYFIVKAYSLTIITTIQVLSDDINHLSNLFSHCH
jgi:solute carrier family 35 protein F1/2